jgi:hypothetical protein
MAPLLGQGSVALEPDGLDSSGTIASGIVVKSLPGVAVFGAARAHATSRRLHRTGPKP